MSETSARPRSETDAKLFEQRIEEILRSRLPIACVAILLAVPGAVAYTLVVRPAPLPAALGIIVWLCALALWSSIRARRLPPGRSGLYIFGLWLLCLSATLSVYQSDRHDPIWAATVLLLYASQGGVQLQRRWYHAANLCAGVAWFAMALGSSNGLRWVDVVVFALTASLGGLSFASGRRYVEELEAAQVERERLRTQFIEAQRLESVGTLAGGLAHDVNNLLTGILGLAHLVRDEVQDRARDDIDEIIAACNRGGQITRNLLAFSRRGQYRLERIELEDVVGHVASLLERTAPKRIKVKIELDGELAVEGDAAQLSQAVLNLCLNAIDAIEGDGWLEIAARELAPADPRPAALGLPPTRYVALAVRDNGSGMDAETASRIFEPFFTTKAAGRGTGLGLAMVYGTVRAHGGQVAVTSKPGEGTEIVMLLPAAAMATRTDAGAAAPLPPATSRAPGRILVVDDDPVVRGMAKRLLSRHGYTVDVAENGADAVELFSKHEFSVVLLDMAMPVMDGAACFAALRKLDPSARVILASGYALQEDTRRMLAEGALGFLHKPYSISTLLAAIRQAADGQRVPVLDEDA